MSHRILLMGAPGAGKGTQAVRISAALGIPTISTGDIFRAHMSEGDDLGRLAASFINEGNLVPDEVTNQMVSRRLSAGDVANGFILDGYPRTLDQAGTLDEMLGERGVTDVVALRLTPDEIVRRLLARAQSEHRADDTEEVIRHRIDVFRESTKPLLDHYEERGLLREVNAIGGLDEITDRILSALGAR